MQSLFIFQIRKMFTLLGLSSGLDIGANMGPVDDGGEFG